MTNTIVIDSGFCNLDSIVRALNECGAHINVSTDPKVIVNADRLVLPGVGSFATASIHLEQSGLAQSIRGFAEKGRPLLGICLGMQLLADSSEEGGVTKGLSLIPGCVRLMVPADSEENIPHVGWNSVHAKIDTKLLSGISDGADFYFSHSYHYCCSRTEDCWADTPYCGTLASVVGYENIMGTQFHPEKSMKNGLRLLSNFLSL